MARFRFPASLSAAETGLFETIVRHPRPLKRGELLYRAGDRFRGIYVVRSGALKSCRPSGSGEEQLDYFGLPGHILGCDALSDGRHPGSAIALQISSVCEIPFSRLEALTQRLPALQRHRALHLTGH
ncbi:MAG TPA: cyclic nucleotide-binding domain-containing protein [Gammaproteobacteria bacterium]|nr:cyclic nucleotide-binding domain-containing protein [Gammaproteobacteria bacterium]